MLVDALRSLKRELRSTLNSNDKRAKIQDSDFIIGLLQAVSMSKGNFSLADLRLSVCQFVGIRIAQSAFNERLGTASMVKNLRFALGALVEVSCLGTQTGVAARLAEKIGVADIIGVDGSMVTLWDGLREHFKGTFMESAFKLHMATNLASGAVRWFDFTPGATHDSQRFSDLKPGNLYVFDLGYWSFTLFQEISNASAFFLSRVKSTAKLTVTEVVYGMGQAIVGQDLLSFQICNKRKKIVELLATTVIDGQSVQLRILGFWDQKTRTYRWYITNLDASRAVIYDLYRLRWQVELSFKAMKSTLNFDQMPTLSKNAIESFALVALINYTFSVILRQEAEIHAKSNNSFPSECSSSILRAAKAFRIGAGNILDALRLGQRITAAWIRRLMSQIEDLLRSIFDPNHRTRKNTVTRLIEG